MLYVAVLVFDWVACRAHHFLGVRTPFVLSQYRNSFFRLCGTQCDLIRKAAPTGLTAYTVARFRLSTPVGFLSILSTNISAQLKVPGMLSVSVEPRLDVDQLPLFETFQNPAFRAVGTIMAWKPAAAIDWKEFAEPDSNPFAIFWSPR